MLIQLAQVLIYIARELRERRPPIIDKCAACVMFVMFRFELKLSVTISIWVTSYMVQALSQPGPVLA